MNVELNEIELNRLIFAMEGSSGSPELSRKLHVARNNHARTFKILPVTPTWSARLGASIEKQMTSIGVTRDRWFTQLIAHAQVMQLEKQITFEMYDKLIIAIESCSEKPLVENGWRDVAGDALRDGNFKRAVELLFENAPDAMPYVSALEALARATIAYVNHVNLHRDDDTALYLKVCAHIDKFIEVRDGNKKTRSHSNQQGAYVEQLEELAVAVGVVLTRRPRLPNFTTDPEFVGALDTLREMYAAHREATK